MINSFYRQTKLSKYKLKLEFCSKDRTNDPVQMATLVKENEEISKDLTFAWIHANQSVPWNCRRQSKLFPDTNLFLTFLIPIEIKAAEEGREWFPREEVLHGLRHLEEQLLAASIESLLALRDQGIVENVDHLRALPLQVLVEQLRRQLGAVLVQFDLVLLNRVQE